MSAEEDIVGQSSHPDQPSRHTKATRGSCPEHRGGAEDRIVVAALVSLAAKGDQRATEALIQRYSGLVWSIAWSYHLSGADAADVSQVVWLRLVENLGRIRQPDSLGAWLGSVTRHECLRLLRRSEREVAVADEFELDEHSDDDDVDFALLSRERDAALRQAFTCLPTRWRALLEMLMDAPSASYEEVAEIVGMPIGSIGPTRQRCLERLRGAPELMELAA